MATTVCAIVPTFNRAHLIGQCIDSLLAQTRPPDDLIVVNDGCTDDTEEVLRAYSGRLRVLRQENAGKAAALNHALGQCGSDYVWICDDDDIAEVDACAALAGALNAEPNAGFAYGPFQRFRETQGVREILPMSYWPQREEGRLFLDLLERCFIFQFSSMVRRSVYDEAGAFDPALLRSQDYDMILRIARRHEGAYVEQPLFLQRQHAGNRGALSDRFAAGALAEKWLVYDRRIFKRLRNELTLDELTPPFARWCPASGMERAALVQRACIFGRHALWAEAISDLEEAAAIAPREPASAGEKAIIRRMLCEPDKVSVLISEPSSARCLGKLVRSSAFGRSIGAPLAAPLFWQIKACAAGREMVAAWEHLRLAVAFAGAQHVARQGAALAVRWVVPNVIPF